MIYFDNASTTKIFDEVADFMCKHSKEQFFNPSGLYAPALCVTKQINEARESLLKLLVANNHKIVFTASATEANNFALRCFMQKNKKMLVSQGEHSCVFETAMHLKQQGVLVEFVKLNSDGTLDLDDFKSKLDDNVGFVSCIHVSNETGAINDIKKIGQILKQHSPQAIFHCDGVQAFCKIPVNLLDLGVDLYTISSHKIHGPRGVGALVFNKNLHPKPLIFGGGQEYGLRSGTENSSAILGFVMAAQIMQKKLEQNMEKILNIKNLLIQSLQELNPNINATANSSPNILSLGFEGVKGEILVHMLEQNQIYVSTGSSCNSKHTGNRVLVAMGKTKQQEAGNIRISFCEFNTTDEVLTFAKVLKDCINKIRGLDIWKK